ncbi:hypothetical protein LSTR_LSTR016516 [Laodelphax striatellus]|uniref:SF3 helicase domain-containing protein n=1 Tax=Laodelphax striatellus TaxID=195883 RepID=A0A482XLN3_LAOST|nr:hypothetical protein LSTR_LSTR016516 [Laodelphax striatellus]
MVEALLLQSESACGSGGPVDEGSSSSVTVSNSGNEKTGRTVRPKKNSHCCMRGIQRPYQYVDDIQFLNTLHPMHTPFSFKITRPLQQNIYGLETSLESLIELLLFQNQNDTIRLRYFLKICYDVIERQSGKKNTVFIHGQSNAGKNFLVDAMSAFYLNVGMIANPSKSERFPFLDCAERRICVWNEARMDPAFYDDIKQILAGDCLKVNVKHHAPVDVVQVPVIVISNFEFLPTNDQFSNRIHRFEWICCPRLQKYIGRKPLPLAAGLLLYWASLASYDNINNEHLRSWFEWNIYKCFL